MVSLRLLTIFALAALASSAQTAQPDAASNSKRITQIWKELKYAPLKPINLPKVEQLTLPNGMRVMLLEDHELPLLHGSALVRTGNLFDPADKVGLAGIAGEMVRVGGTKSKTGDQIDIQLENIAASVESNIGESSGTVSFSCLKENTAEVMAIFKEILTSPELRADKLELLKNQSMSGISRRNDEPGQIAQREFTNILYGRDNSYGWDAQYATIDRIQRADVQAFYRRYFFPKNVILGIQGDFDTAQMKASLQSLFADWTVQQAPVPRFPSVEFKYKPGTYLATMPQVNQTTLAMGQRGGQRKDKDYAALEVMSNILGSGFNSRLFRRIRTKLGYAYDVDANWAANWDHPGMFVLNASTKSSTTVQTVEVAREETQRMRTEPVTEEELESAKEIVLNSLVFSLDTPSKVLNRLLVYTYFDYPKDFIFQFQKAVKELTRQDIQRVAMEYLDPTRFIVVAVGNPKEFGESLEKLGSKVIPLDLTIPKPAGAKSDPAPHAGAVPEN